MKLLGLALTALAAVAFSAHADLVSDIISNEANNIISKTYIDLVNSGAKFQADLTTLKQQPTDANLAIVQRDWQETRAFWEISESFLFGPVESLHIDENVDTWPTNKDLKRYIARSDQSLRAVASFPEDARGFHGIEYMLFGEPASPTHSAQQLDAHDFQYLISATALLTAQVNQLVVSWTAHADPKNSNMPSYTYYITNPSRSGNPFYNSHAQAMSNLVAAMSDIVNEVANTKMAKPMGGDKNHVNDSLVESPYSLNSLADFQNNIRSTQNVWNGTYNGQKTGPGVSDFVATINPGLAQNVDSQIAQAIQAIGDVAGPTGMDFATALHDDQGRVRSKAAIDLLNALKKTIDGPVTATLANIKN